MPICPCLLALLTAAWDQSSFWLGLKQAIMFDMPPITSLAPPQLCPQFAMPLVSPEILQVPEKALWPLSWYRDERAAAGLP